MVVQLPPQPAGTTALPAQPQNPPTLDDVFNAVNYNSNIRASHVVNTATRSDVANGSIYEYGVIGEPAVAPPWFAAALAIAMPPILARLLTPLTRVTYINYNLQCGDGLQRPFEIIPFQVPNGDDPRDAPHNLPPLRTENDIMGLSGPQCHAYLVGYGVPAANVPHTVVARKTALRAHIGCSVGI